MLEQVGACWSIATRTNQILLELWLYAVHTLLDKNRIDPYTFFSF